MVLGKLRPPGRRDVLDLPARSTRRGRGTGLSAGHQPGAGASRLRTNSAGHHALSAAIVTALSPVRASPRRNLHYAPHRQRPGGPSATCGESTPGRPIGAIQLAVTGTSTPSGGTASKRGLGGTQRRLTPGLRASASQRLGERDRSGGALGGRPQPPEQSPLSRPGSRGGRRPGGRASLFATPGSRGHQRRQGRGGSGPGTSQPGPSRGGSLPAMVGSGGGIGQPTRSD